MLGILMMSASLKKEEAKEANHEWTKTVKRSQHE
jgi:hypothetical protein